MKKILGGLAVVMVIVAVVIVFVMTAPFKAEETSSEENQATSYEETASQEEEIPGFIRISADEYNSTGIWSVQMYYFSETKVMYALVRDDNNSAAVGSFIMMVNADGSPLLYEGTE